MTLLQGLVQNVFIHSGGGSGGGGSYSKSPFSMQGLYLTQSRTGDLEPSGPDPLRHLW